MVTGNALSLCAMLGQQFEESYIKTDVPVLIKDLYFLSPLVVWVKKMFEKGLNPQEKMLRVVVMPVFVLT